MKLLLGSGKVLGATFLAFQERACYSEYLSSREASGLLLANSWIPAVPTPGVASFLSRQTGIPLDFARQECTLFPEDRLLLALYAEEGGEEFPESFQENTQVSWILFQVPQPLFYSPPSGRVLRLSRRDILAQSDVFPQESRLFLAVDPRKSSARVLSQNFYGNPEGLREQEEFFPLSMTLERNDGYLPGMDWYDGSPGGEGLLLGRRRSYRISWE